MAHASRRAAACVSVTCLVLCMVAPMHCKMCHRPVKLHLPSRIDGRRTLLTSASQLGPRSRLISPAHPGVSPYTHTTARSHLTSFLRAKLLSHLASASLT